MEWLERSLVCCLRSGYNKLSRTWERRRSMKPVLTATLQRVQLQVRAKVERPYFRCQSRAESKNVMSAHANSSSWALHRFSQTGRVNLDHMARQLSQSLSCLGVTGVLTRGIALTVFTMVRSKEVDSSTPPSLACILSEKEKKRHAMQRCCVVYRASFEAKQEAVNG